MSDQLAVSEIFGPTVQGEGASLGRQAVFLRLAMCNLKCMWCDTSYTWDFAGQNGRAYNKSDEVKLMSLEQVGKQLLAHAGFANLLVVTGGEPLLQARGLEKLFEEAWWLEDVEIETNGTIVPIPDLGKFVTHYNVSPKLENSGNPVHRAVAPKALEFFAHNKKARFKFVVSKLSDFDEIRLKFVEPYEISNEAVWIMPEGTSWRNQENSARYFAEETIARGWNLTTRLHLLLWDNKRGH